MEKYIKPNINIYDSKLEAIMAGSLEGAEKILDNENEVDDVYVIEAKQYHYSVWDEDQTHTLHLQRSPRSISL